MTYSERTDPILLKRRAFTLESSSLPPQVTYPGITRTRKEVIPVSSGPLATQCSPEEIPKVMQLGREEISLCMHYLRHDEAQLNTTRKEFMPSGIEKSLRIESHSARNKIG